MQHQATLLLLLTGLAVLGAAQDVESSDFPQACQQQCQGMISLSTTCDQQTDDDTAQRQCVCNGANAQSEATGCASCVAANGQGINGSDLAELMNACGWNHADGAAGSASAAVSTVTSGGGAYPTATSGDGSAYPMATSGSGGVYPTSTPAGGGAYPTDTSEGDDVSSTVTLGGGSTYPTDTSGGGGAYPTDTSGDGDDNTTVTPGGGGVYTTATSGGGDGFTTVTPGGGNGGAPTPANGAPVATITPGAAPLATAGMGGVVAGLVVALPWLL